VQIVITFRAGVAHHTSLPQERIFPEIRQGPGQQTRRLGFISFNPTYYFIGLEDVFSSNQSPERKRFACRTAQSLCPNETAIDIRTKNDTFILK